MITKEAMLRKYNLSEEYFQDADISWENLTAIYDDYLNYKYDKYKQILSEFEQTYLLDTKKAEIHSFRARIKDSERLIVKIIRKRKENYRKYRGLTKDNYEKFLTDLIGIRCFILFKEQWRGFHEFITKEFEQNPLYYVKDAVKDFDENETHCYIAEKPKVHIRNGDSREIYEGVLTPECILSDKIYRSVHYIIKYKGVYLEIQVRTLFEEGWGEIDHEIIYPYYQEDPVLKQYTQLLNRLTGLADEMGSFFNGLKLLEVQNIVGKPQEGVRDALPGPEVSEKFCTEGKEADAEIDAEIKAGNTPADCLYEVIQE